MNVFKNFLNDLPIWTRALIGIVAVGATTYVIIRKNSKKGPYKKDYEPNVVYVYQFPRAGVIPSLSPYALKLETWLRMADIKYENVPIPLWVRSSEGTLPFIELNGVEYDDSSFIIRDLTALLKKEPLDAWMSLEQKAVSRAFEQMVENSTFLSYGYLRYTEHFDQLFKPDIGFHIPAFWRMLKPLWKIKLEYHQKLHDHGIGRHPRDEIIRIGLDDLKSMALYLGTKKFFHGEKPTRVDAYLFSVLAQILHIPVETPHQKALNTDYQNLKKYCDRIRARFWPDWDEICKTRELNTWKK